MKDYDETVTAWVTKYALSNGVIFKTEGRVPARSEGRMLCYRRGAGMEEYAHGKDWHRTPDEAIKRANEMRAAKIKSLVKQIAKLEVMDFSLETRPGVSDDNP